MAANGDVLEGLRDLPGQVFTSSSAAYEWLSRLPSSIARKRRPMAVAMPRTLLEVKQCDVWAAARGTTVTVVGGGHSGHCVWDDALAIDLRHGFGEARLLGDGGQRIAVGGGASLAAIVEAAEAGGRMCCVGTAPTVGAGLLLQGGVGHLARWRGLAVDTVEQVAGKRRRRRAGVRTKVSVTSMTKRAVAVAVATAAASTGAPTAV